MNNLPVLVLLVILVIGGGYFLRDSFPDNLTNNNQENPTSNNFSNTLDLSNQGLIQVSGGVFKKTSLVELNLSNNNLSGSLQAEVRHLQNLKVLDLSSNNFTGIPAEVGQLKNLEILDLSNNQLTGLPNEIGNLQNLKVLNISGNNYSELDLAEIQKRLPSTTEIIK